MNTARHALVRPRGARRARAGLLAAASAAFTGALLGLALLSGPANATTLTCTGLANSLTAPIGCGGLQFSYIAKGVQDISAAGDYWNAHVVSALDSGTNSAEDFTVFALNGSTTDGPGSLGIYVAMYTPLGKFSFIPAGTLPAGDPQVLGTTYTNTYPYPGSEFTATPTDYCLSVETGNTGPRDAQRWRTVLRTCATNGTFTYGNDVTGTGNVVNSVSSSSANRFQLWAPVTGSTGLLFINDSLSHGFTGNTPYVLDLAGNGGPGTWLLAYPENDQPNQEGSILGCSQPVTLLDTTYASCP
jgi:hypothetical protein